MSNKAQYAIALALFVIAIALLYQTEQSYTIMILRLFSFFMIGSLVFHYFVSAKN